MEIILQAKEWLNILALILNFDLYFHGNLQSSVFRTLQMERILCSYGNEYQEVCALGCSAV
jgi:hypothetical protein